MATDVAVPGATARRIGVPQGMDRALARIRSPRGDVVGSGFLVGARHVVTCTHVVLRALGRADRDAVGEATPSRSTSRLSRRTSSSGRDPRCPTDSTRTAVT